MMALAIVVLVRMDLCDGLYLRGVRVEREGLREGEGERRGGGGGRKGVRMEPGGGGNCQRATTWRGLVKPREARPEAADPA